MKDKIEFKTVVEDIPLDINKNTLFNINTKNVNQLTHGFHKYPGKFIPQIPAWAIDKYLGNVDNATILDPFCGSGTTLVEGFIKGYNVIGIDIDPLSVLLSKVKTTKINISYFSTISNWLIEKIQDQSILERFLPKIKTLTHWFTEEAIDKLGKIRFLIDEIPYKFNNTNDIHDLLIICFSSIIRRVSNADNQSQKTFVSHTNKKNPEEVYYLFMKQLNYYKTRIYNFNNICKANRICKVIRKTSTQDFSSIFNQKIDLVVTSPPYIKAIDYIYNQMAELFWIGDLFNIETQEKQNLLKPEYIGNKQIKKVEYSNFLPSKNITGINFLDDALNSIYEQDNKNGHKHSFITWKFFNEMDRHFRHISRILDKETHYIIIIGDSSVSNVKVETAKILTMIAENNNFKLYNKWGYKIKNRYMRFDRKGRGGLIKIDWVLDLKKS